jgi:hypothetical protein
LLFSLGGEASLEAVAHQGKRKKKKEKKFVLRSLIIIVNRQSDFFAVQPGRQKETRTRMESRECTAV